MRRRPPSPGREGKAGEVRPVGARALKSAGDTLRPYLEGARVLDLFAGHGRFGAMALEEGADRVVLVERDGKHARQLTADLSRYGDRVHVAATDVFPFLIQHRESYDIVFADPPFPLWDATFGAKLFAAIAPRLSDDAILLVKCPKGVVPSHATPALLSWKESPFGESTLRYYRYGK